MSDTTGTGRHGTETGTTAPVGAGRGFRVAREAYSFACLRCGHGWEQSYDIEHHIDARGREVVVYRTEGREVPSPLSQPTCGQCDGHVVRIMRPGRVSTVLDSMHARRPSGSTRAPRKAAAGGAGDGASGGSGSGDEGRHLWHMPNLLRMLHLQRRPH